MSAELVQLRQLRDLVIRMRDAQRRYFTSRNLAALEESKGLERRVDRMVAELIDRQGQLFESTDVRMEETER